MLFCALGCSKWFLGRCSGVLLIHFTIDYSNMITNKTLIIVSDDQCFSKRPLQVRRYTNISILHTRWLTSTWTMSARKGTPFCGTWSRMTMQYVNLTPDYLKYLTFRISIVIFMLSWWLDPPIRRLDQWGREAVVLSGLLVHWPSDPHAFHRGLSGEPRQSPVRSSQKYEVLCEIKRDSEFLQVEIFDCFCLYSSGQWWCLCVCCQSCLGPSSSSAPAMTLIG